MASEVAALSTSAQGGQVFDLLAQDSQSKARRGRLTTDHGIVETPAFMPVGTQGTVKAVSPRELHELSAHIILGNTYHLFVRPGLDVIKHFGGLHRFINWGGPILTDSGGYQIFSLARLRKITGEGVHFQNHVDGTPAFISPEIAMEIQAELGSDIAMVLDECPPWPCARDYAARSLEMTLRWARRCKAWKEDNIERRIAPLSGTRPAGVHFGCPSGSVTSNVEHRTNQTDEDNAQGSTSNAPRATDLGAAAVSGGGSSLSSQLSTLNQLVFGIVQGATFDDLRRESAEALVEIGFDGYAIGGVSVGEPEEEMMRAVEASEPVLPNDKPRYAMGLGTPPQMLEMVARGIDMFDCVLPTRLARNGTAFTRRGTLNLKNAEFAFDKGPIEEGCACSACADFSRGYIRHLIKAEEILGLRLITLHNLHFYLDLMSEAREHIEQGTFEMFRREFVSRYQIHEVEKRQL